MNQESEKNIIKKREEISKNELAKFAEPSLEEEISVLEKKLIEKKREKEFIEEKKRKEIIEKEKEKRELIEKVKEKEFSLREKIEMAERIEEETIQPKITVITDEDQDSDQIVNDLIEIAFKEGIEKIVIKKIKYLDNPYILDEFHDRLIEKLKELRKKIERIES